ncbi:hypothetical protein I316_03965 [Kwoniella heveanensis BCC8398]|uniref:Uncharacterized protein n=1 Tax=Kwoniella heveanensis BCC8398 TaxID=1296120 RepID=A0A1B9GTU5_9TREE|nr:hypothetical protein I316_03965 [Kwoniella heveanensis BCC8398]
MPRAQTTAQRKSKSRQPISSTPLNIRRSARTQHGDTPRLSSNHSPSQEATQTQSQTQLEQSFISISTAPLPERYEINLALPADVKLNETEKEEAYVRGEELLSDGWRKSTDHEGKLRDIRTVQRMSRRLVTLSATDNNDLSSAVELPARGEQIGKGNQPLWYTADLAFPCVCSLDRLKYAYTFVHPPPTSSSLSEGYPSDAQSIAQSPARINDLPAWSTSISLDLDPSVDQIDDFEILWAIPLHIHSTIPASQVSESGTVVEMTESPEARRERKGKYRAVDVDSLMLDTDNHMPDKIVDGMVLKKVASQPEGGPKVTSALPNNAHVSRPARAREVHTANTAWEEESKRRKSRWRRLIRDDAGYGKVWEFLPLPYSHPVRYFPQVKPTKKKIRLKSTIPPYKLPKAYLSQAHPISPSAQNSSRYSQIGPYHPFHPSLHGYIRAYPKNRVYWLVPLHGPVLIPTLNHPLDDTGDVHFDAVVAPIIGRDMDAQAKMKDQRKIVPSTGHLLDNLADIPGNNQKERKPTPVKWTPSLLLSFLERFLHPLYLDPSMPLGTISYAFSGPKPDPFLDLPTPKPLDRHLVVDLSLTSAEEAANDQSAQNRQELARAETADEQASRPKARPKITTASANQAEAGSDVHTVKPVRPEAGDHLRIYCDAAHALQLRTWLHNVRIPLSGGRGVAAAETRPGATTAKVYNGNAAIIDGGESEEVRVLYKTRLTLVGDRGEVLMVA